MQQARCIPRASDAGGGSTGDAWKSTDDWALDLSEISQAIARAMRQQRWANEKEHYSGKGFQPAIDITISHNANRRLGDADLHG
eukprot:5138073-Pyramimonas_sp.AAC.1